MLDQNLFTLYLTPSPTSPTTHLDLTSPSTPGTPYYTRIRHPTPTYSISLLDPSTHATLSTTTSPSPTSKSKTIELFNPPAVIELRYTGTLSFRWKFTWGDHNFEWRREECFLVQGKKEAAVLVAVTKEPVGKIKTSLVQILDYNLNRFDIEDRKGFEITLLMSLLTFQDYNEQPATTVTSPPTTAVISTSSVPHLPAKPTLTGVDLIASLHAQSSSRSSGEYNHVYVQPQGSADDYARFIATELLADEAILFVAVKSGKNGEDKEMVGKVLKVVEQTKRIRHKAGVVEELHQYVAFEQVPRTAGKVINLDDKKGKKGEEVFDTPESITIHLSKIPLPELAPRPAVPPLDTRTIAAAQGYPVDEMGVMNSGGRGDRKGKKKGASTQAATTPNKLTRPAYAPSPTSPAGPSTLHRPPAANLARRSTALGTFKHLPAHISEPPLGPWATSPSPAPSRQLHIPSMFHSSSHNDYPSSPHHHHPSSSHNQGGHLGHMGMRPHQGYTSPPPEVLEMPDNPGDRKSVV